MIRTRDQIELRINGLIDAIIEQTDSPDVSERYKAREMLENLVNHVYEAGLEDRPANDAYMKAELTLLRKDAVFIGEDGDMTCVAPNPEHALAKFKRLYRHEVDEYEAEQLILENVSVGYLRLPPLTEREESEYAWLIHWDDKALQEKKGYQVYVYRD